MDLYRNGVSGEYPNEVLVGSWWGSGANLASKSRFVQILSGNGRDDFPRTFNGHNSTQSSPQKLILDGVYIVFDALSDGSLRGL